MNESSSVHNTLEHQLELARSAEVEHRTGDYIYDFFEGSKSALILAGVAREGEFPGDPGRGRTSVTIRSDLPPEEGEAPHNVPGYRMFQRTAAGFRVTVTVDRPTQQARRGPVKAIQLQHRDYGTQRIWCGTKEQLQAKGFGRDLAFPGEPGEPKTKTIPTSLGLQASIESGLAPGEFLVRVVYRPPEERNQAIAAFNAQWFSVGADGVKVDRSWRNQDAYTGSATALCARGLVRADELPGAPGRGITAVTYGRDGVTIPKGGNGGKGAQPGWRKIQRISAKSFCVRIFVSREEESRRAALHNAFEAQQKEIDQKARDDWEARAEAKRALSRMPKSADAFRREIIGSMRSMLRVTLDAASDSPGWHGFTIDPESIALSFDAVVQAVLQAEVTLDSARQQRVEQGHRAKIADGDATFQSRLKQLVQPNPSLLEGEQP